jgi:hypothetical protein
MLLSKHSSCLILTFASYVAIAGEPSGATDKSDWDSWKKIVVVAELRAGQYLPQSPECAKPDIICMDPPPFWFSAKIMSTVYGESPPVAIHVTTGSHFGMGEYERMEAPQLVLLRTNGEKFVMPRYAKAPLIRAKDGKLYLRTFRKPTLSWLPCETASLREEIYPANFEGDGLEIEKDAFSNYRVETNPTMYRITRTGAWPRYAIPVDRLREFLAASGPEVELACKSQP